ncbi:MAG: hypothetical protein ACYCVB_16010 [Bacilli bacterium]
MPSRSIYSPGFWLTTLALISCGGIRTATPAFPAPAARAAARPAGYRPLLVEAVSPQPSGILITVWPRSGRLSSIVSRPRIIPAEGHQMSQLTFTLTRVSPGPHIDLGRRLQVWNQTLSTLEVRRVKNGLTVAVSFEGLFQHLRMGVADGRYLGISLTREPGSLPPVNGHAVVPAWFLRDLLKAGSRQYVPTSMASYGQLLPFRSSDRRDMLMAPYHGSQEVLGYGSYFGAIRMDDLYRILDVRRIAAPPPIQRRNIRERTGGRFVRVPAVIQGMQNPWGIGFARNQLIVTSDEGGYLAYSVYNVPDIRIPPAHGS